MNHAAQNPSRLQVVDTSGPSHRRISEITTSPPYNLPNGAYETGHRKVSSIILHEEVTGEVPEPNVRYVEVPQYEEVIKHVIMKETREIEKIVPKIIEEWVERVVEVNHVETVVKHVEVPQIQEVIKHVPKIEIHDRYTEVVRHVPKIEIRRIEKVVEVPGDIIEVPQPFTVEESMPVANYHDSEQMLIVAQTVKPVIVEGGKEVHVEVLEYEPEVIPVDIHVARFVDQTLVAMGAKETTHRVVTVPAAQYNSMLRFLNVHLSDSDMRNLPYLQDVNGQVKFLPEEYQWCAPPEGIKIYGYQKGLIYGEGTPVITKHVHTRDNLTNRQAELDTQFNLTLSQFESEKERRLKHIEEFNVRSQHHCSQLISSAH
eukprot:GHVH01008266.1.p1 GENE.GHVH01008266.1~~GHVH01008266.1.p1  ORF type:complete len:372 (+),score=67.87 GHVH01008266.1:268-1383(+)